MLAEATGAGNKRWGTGLSKWVTKKTKPNCWPGSNLMGLRIQETIPQEYKDATIIHLYKRKGNRQDCNNHRGISLLSIAGKILTRLLLNCLTDHLNQGLLPESQCVFRKICVTINMIFAAR